MTTYADCFSPPNEPRTEQVGPTPLGAEIDRLRAENADLRRLIDRGTPISEHEKRAASELDALRAIITDLRQQLADCLDWEGRMAEALGVPGCDPEEMLNVVDGLREAHADECKARTSLEGDRIAEGCDETVIGTHSGKSEHREWWTGGEWLYPGDEIVSRSKAE